MKRTHKLRALGDVTGIMAGARSISEAARRVGVNRSTVHRWIQAGKVPGPAGLRARRAGPAGGAKAHQTPAAWARAIRGRYALTETEGQLLALAEAALRLARDPGESPTIRLAAMARYQGLVKDLHLEDEHGEAETPASVRTFPVIA